MSTTAMTPQQLLDLPLPDNDSGATTVRGYLIELLATVWRDADGFDAKRPFGMDDWPYDLYVPMVRAGLVAGDFSEDGDIERVDWKAADRLILAAIRELGAWLPVCAEHVEAS